MRIVFEFESLFCQYCYAHWSKCIVTLFLNIGAIAALQVLLVQWIKSKTWPKISSLVSCKIWWDYLNCLLSGPIKTMDIFLFFTWWTIQKWWSTRTFSLLSTSFILSTSITCTAPIPLAPMNPKFYSIPIGVLSYWVLIQIPIVMLTLFISNAVLLCIEENLVTCVWNFLKYLVCTFKIYQNQYMQDEIGFLEEMAGLS